MIAAVFLSAILLAAPANSNPHWWKSADPPIVHGKAMDKVWWEMIKRSCVKHNVNPFLVAAVAYLESNWKAGRINDSPYWGPMGLNEECDIPDIVLETPLENIRWAVPFLKGGMESLKRYNAEWDKDDYMGGVSRLKNQLEDEAFSDFMRN